MAYRQVEQTAETKTEEKQSSTEKENVVQRQTAVSPLAALGGDHNAQAANLHQQTNGNLSRAGNTLLRLQNQYGNQYVQRLVNPQQQITVQPKLMLGAPDTPHEREAEEMANQLVGNGAVATSPTPVTDAQTAVSTKTEVAINQARGGGSPLDENVREPLEKSLGADLTGVRVHTDSRADTLNQTLFARAFTTGQDIFFQRGEYTPASPEGQRILTHELTHVLQQNPGIMQGQPGTHNINSVSAGQIQRTLDQTYTVNWLTNQVTENGMLEEADSTDYYQKLLVALQNYWAHVGDSQESAMLTLLKNVAIQAQNELWVQIVTEIETFIESIKKEPMPSGNNENEELKIVSETEIPKKERKPMVTIDGLRQFIKKYNENAQQLEKVSKLAELRRIAHYAMQLLYWVNNDESSIQWLNKTINAANQDYANELANVKSVKEAERNTIIVHQGQGAMGHLGRVVLISNYFLSCIPVVMFNQSTKLGGLFHVSSGQSAIMNQAPELLEMAKAIHPTQIFVNKGSMGSEMQDLNALKKLFANNFPKAVVMTKLKLAKLRITLAPNGQDFYYRESTQATQSKFDLFNIRDDKELTDLPVTARAYTSREVEYYEPEKDVFAKFKV